MGKIKEKSTTLPHPKSTKKKEKRVDTLILKMCLKSELKDGESNRDLDEITSKLIYC